MRWCDNFCIVPFEESDLLAVIHIMDTDGAFLMSNKYDYASSGQGRKTF